MFLIDPVTGHTVLRAKQVLAVTGNRVLTSNGSNHPLMLTDLRERTRVLIRWPSALRFTAEAVVDPSSGRIALAFADPSYDGTGMQVMDIWLLDASTGRIEQLPDMPARVALKFTSMSWANDNRLVMLAQSEGHDLVAVWRPGEERIAVRSVKLPVRDGGSDTFVAWPSGRQR